MQPTSIPTYRGTSRLTRKGQVTVPVEIRRQLGLKSGDRVAFVQDGERIMIEPARSVAERTAGMLAAYRRVPPLSAEEERAAFDQAVAEEVAESLER